LLHALAEGYEAAAGLSGGTLQFEGIAPAYQATRLDEAGTLQRVERHQHARADGEAIGELVGVGLDGSADRHLRGAERELVADLETEALEQDWIDGGTRLAPDGVAKRHAAGKREAADQGIGGIDALELHQYLVGAVDAARHGAQGSDLADAALM